MDLNHFRIVPVRESLLERAPPMAAAAAAGAARRVGPRATAAPPPLSLPVAWSDEATADRDRPARSSGVPEWLKALVAAVGVMAVVVAAFLLLRPQLGAIVAWISGQGTLGVVYFILAFTVWSVLLLPQVRHKIPGWAVRAHSGWTVWLHIRGFELWFRSSPRPRSTHRPGSAFVTSCRRVPRSSLG